KQCLGKFLMNWSLDVPASEAWDLYSTSRLSKLVMEEIPNYIERLDIIQGDGGAGSVLKLTFAPGVAGPSSYIEKFTKIDNEKRVKEAELIEGGYLELGFSLYRYRYEVIEKGNDSSIIKSSIEYDIKEDAAPNTSSLLNLHTLAHIAQLAKLHLTKNKSSSNL
ncbi:S-norcoclaurine synthase-like, partial [Quillaja saponaria]